MKKIFLIAFLLIGFTAKSQLSLVNSFNPVFANGLCALGHDAAQNKLWIYECNGDSIYCIDTTGAKLLGIKAPGEVANDVDIEIAPVSFQFSGTTIPQGTILFINGETSSAEVYAIDPLTGVVLDTLFTAFGNSHIVGGAYHIPSGTMYMVQDNVPGVTLGNRIGEVNAVNGSFIQDFSISNLFNVSYGDMEGAENGNLYVTSSVEDSIMEITSQGVLVQMHALPAWRILAFRF